MTAAPALLDIRGLQSWFRTPRGMIRAVADVSLTVGAGQAIGVVGESGSGKTQTFYSTFGLSHGWPGVVKGSAMFDGADMLAGLDEYARWGTSDEGVAVPVEKDSQRWNAIHHKRLARILGRQVSMIFQDARRSLVPYWTIRQHLDKALEKAEPGKSVAGGAAELLSRFGFRDARHVLEAYPEQLSGGEAQRAMLAFAMATAPRLLIADEPTTALDALSQLRVLREIQRIHEESDVAVVLISHDLAVVQRVVEHVVVLFGGTVVERAPISVFMAGGGSLRHPYSAELYESQRRRMAGLPIAGHTSESGGSRRPMGCQYAARCARRSSLSAATSAKCESESPPEVQVGENHFASCWGATA